MRIPLVVLATLSFTALAQQKPVADTQPSSAADVAAIKKSFSDYKAALARKDGKGAASLVDSATHAYYADMRKLALEADAPTVRKQSLIDKLMVLRMRSEFTPAQLRAMNAQQLIALGVDRGWVGSNTGENDVGEITVTGDRARGQAIIRGEVAPFFHEFRREGGHWKMNLVDLMRAVGPAMSEAARRMDMSEDEFVLFALEQGVGRKPDPAIWDGPKATAKKKN